MSTRPAYLLDRADPADADAIRDLEGLSASTRRLLEVDLARSDRVVVVARQDDRVVGVATVNVATDDAHLLDLAVAVAHRRRGLGSELLRSVRAAARDEQGATAMTLEVRASNAAARALYRLLGFDEVGRRPGYYPDGGPDGGREDAVIMWDRDLTD